MCQIIDNDICIKTMLRFGPRFPASQVVTLTSNYSQQDFDSLIIRGDALENLRRFKDDYFRCCVTSPPYWGLRDYGEPHQIGAEPELQDYIDNLVMVFREVRRTLAPDGTLWLNIGDSYTSGNRSWRDTDRKNPARAMSYRPPTLGPQLRGGVNTESGKDAAERIFKLLKSLVSPYLKLETDRSLIIENDSKRTVTIEFSSDPDIRIIETIGSINRPLVSIEIKGGRDKSNIHNRIGEAEKSHQKPRERASLSFGRSLELIWIIRRQKDNPLPRHIFSISTISRIRTTKNTNYSGIC